MKKAIVVFHRVDTDGVLSYVIAKKRLEIEGFEVIPVGYNYGDPFPEFPVGAELFCMVDVSFTPDVMISIKNLYGTDKFIWIDHHVSSIKASDEQGYTDLTGIRRIGTAACELCWEFFFPDNTVPDIVQFASAYDVWNKDRFDWNKVLAIQYGFRNKYGNSIKDIDNDFYCIDVESLETEGNIILKYLNRKWKSDVKNYAFEVTVGGKYKGICMIGTEFSSNVFGSVLKDYDLYLVCNRKGTDLYNISMYKEPDRLPEFSCAEYLIQFGGGGHISAAGSTLNKEQFNRLIMNCEI